MIEPNGPKTGFEKGLTIEHILLSVMVVSTKESAGQFDDTAARGVEKYLKELHGVERVEAKTLYEHTKIEQHPNECKCGKCVPWQPQADSYGNPVAGG